MVSKDASTYICSGGSAACPGLGGYGSLLLEAGGDLDNTTQVSSSWSYFHFFGAAEEVLVDMASVFAASAGSGPNGS